jgi:hypothetical protein
MRIILFLFLLCSPAFAAEWTTYVNPRFGASVDIPPGFVNDVPASENGDGLVFHSADKQAELLVWGGNLTDGDFKLDSEIRLNRELDYDWQVSYKESGNDWSVYSGSQSGRIMYARAMSSCRGTQAVHFRIEYPEAQKKDYDAIVERLSKSLKAGTASDCP